MQIGATTWGQQWMPPAMEARAAGAAGRREDAAGSNAAAGISGSSDCQTCKGRKYTDRSSDPTVSFQTPTSLNPEQASTAVRSHEQQHVVHEQARARENGQRVVAQSVTIHSAICPECGRSYVSGGTTTTTTRSTESGYSSSGTSQGSASGALVDRRY